MPLSSELTRLLSEALSSRAASASELATATGRSEPEVARGLDELRDLGYLEGADGALTYRRPEIPATEAVGRDLRSMVEHLAGAADDIAARLGTLPALLQAWEAGGADERSIPVDVARGPRAPNEAWMTHFTRDTPRHCDLCLPDLSPLLAGRSEDIGDWARTAMTNLRVRLVVSRADATDPRWREPLARMLARGTQVRAHPDPPSFLWVSDGAVAGIPDAWGEAWPTPVLTIRSTPVAEAVAAIFTATWQAGTPIGREPQPWDPMLHLMNQGMTMEAAAARLGLAHRTARRRVAEAMAYYDVSSHFTLGAAWARDR
ncbi:hypothetical protein LQF12_10895 [Ruania suaedae]|uniref:hypothetical protein n=1 Tax=Ruania suaedae TaxID=2897774 RepID=UPI001E5F1AA4|nr:hypothetical protein [Ruania suaedae]UFU02018.1 hypothetical protein LQF12_10895 [Ruania suaedae]